MSEQLIFYALDILKARADYWEKNEPMYAGYNSAVAILTAAIKGQEEILRQFDYYPRDGK